MLVGAIAREARDLQERITKNVGIVNAYRELLFDNLFLPLIFSAYSLGLYVQI